MEAFSFNINYLCQKMSDMSGLPIRIYEDGLLKDMYCVLPLVVDPVILYEKELLKKDRHVSYYLTDMNNYYGIITSEKIKIIIGPVISSTLSNQDIRNLAFKINVKPEDIDSFSNALRTIVHMPLDSVIQMMCTINHILNHEELNVSDFQIKESSVYEKYPDSITQSDSDVYRSYNVEKQLLDIVKNGDTLILDRWIKEAPTVKSGMMSDNLLRQNKDTFIVTITLITRVAINEGVDMEDAFKMSNLFIQRCENLDDISKINSLQYEALNYFTSEIGKLKNNTNKSSLMVNVYYYIQHHLSDSIKTDDIARDLYMSRSNLSTIFKKETGINLNDYIHIVKIEIAKELLKDHSKNITIIGDYLGYSSTSHFSKVFKKISGETPLSYRKKINAGN